MAVASGGGGGRGVTAVVVSSAGSGGMGHHGIVDLHPTATPTTAAQRTLARAI